MSCLQIERQRFSKHRILLSFHDAVCASNFSACFCHLEFFKGADRLQLDQFQQIRTYPVAPNCLNFSQLNQFRGEGEDPSVCCWVSATGNISAHCALKTESRAHTTHQYCRKFIQKFEPWVSSRAGNLDLRKMLVTFRGRSRICSRGETQQNRQSLRRIFFCFCIKKPRFLYPRLPAPPPNCSCLAPDCERYEDRSWGVAPSPGDVALSLGRGSLRPWEGIPPSRGRHLSVPRDGSPLKPQNKLKFPRT